MTAASATPINASLASVLALPRHCRAASAGAPGTFDIFHSYQIEQHGDVLTLFNGTSNGEISGNSHDGPDHTLLAHCPDFPPSEGGHHSCRASEHNQARSATTGALLFRSRTSEIARARISTVSTASSMTNWCDMLAVFWCNPSNSAVNTSTRRMAEMIPTIRKGCRCDVGGLMQSLSRLFLLLGKQIRQTEALHFASRVLGQLLDEVNNLGHLEVR